MESTKNIDDIEFGIINVDVSDTRTTFARCSIGRAVVWCGESRKG
jgi:hypothetical protein